MSDASKTVLLSQTTFPSAIPKISFLIIIRLKSKKYSTFFEYNSRFFLTGLSMAPFQKIPVSGTLALIISDHIDNYKVHDFSALNWVFQVRVGL